MSNNIYGIDFGTCNFKVFSKSSGKVISEKNTIAIINKTQIYAYGMMPMQCMKKHRKASTLRFRFLRE